ncbi:hypothetical protein ACHQM5_005848 [Ranunculus cassubicifolius]
MDLDVGRHCQHSECHQLDFLPFKCDGCEKIRKVIICEICSTSIEVTGKDSEEEVKKMLEKHEKSKDCDPAKKKKPKCPVRRCKQNLTFSNNATCKVCHVKVCLAHRFPADHACTGGSVKSGVQKFLSSLGARNGKDCGSSMASSSSRKTPPSVQAY